MKKLISLLLLSVTFAFADEGSDAKHPWYTDFYGNNIFSSFQRNLETWTRPSKTL